MRRALAATERALTELREATNRPRLKPATALPRISRTARPTPIQAVPRRRPGRQLAPAPATPAPQLIGPGKRDHPDTGRHLAAALGFWDFRDRLAGDIRQKKVRPDPEALIDHGCREYGLDPADAAEWMERFLSAVGRDLQRRAPA